MSDHANGRRNLGLEMTPKAQALLKLGWRVRTVLNRKSGYPVPPELIMDILREVWAQGWRPPADDPMPETLTEQELELSREYGTDIWGC